jgi:hypothetical protein
MASGCSPVPLTEFQADVCSLLAVNRSPDRYLAGGATMHIEPSSKRYDLDYFRGFGGSSRADGPRRQTIA